MLARIASPSAPPIMNDVLTMPDASPDSSGFTSPRAARSTGLNAMPAPNPSRIMLGRTSTMKFPSTVAHDELRRQAERERAHDQVRGQERQPDLKRCVAEHELQIEGRHEEPGEH